MRKQVGKEVVWKLEKEVDQELGQEVDQEVGWAWGCRVVQSTSLKVGLGLLWVALGLQNR